jgi:DNA polymerase III alpha subunit
LIENELEMIRNPPFSLDDDPSWIVAQEVKFLGCPISLAKIDAADTSEATTTCKEIVDGKHGKNLCVAGNIVREASFKTKNGKSAGQLMSFLTIEDDTCTLDGVVVFPEARKLHEYMLYEGNNALFCGEVKKGDNSFIIEKIHEI